MFLGGSLRMSARLAPLRIPVKHGKNTLNTTSDHKKRRKAADLEPAISPSRLLPLSLEHQNWSYRHSAAPNSSWMFPNLCKKVSEQHLHVRSCKLIVDDCRPKVLSQGEIEIQTEPCHPRICHCCILKYRPIEQKRGNPKALQFLSINLKLRSTQSVGLMQYQHSRMPLYKRPWAHGGWVHGMMTGWQHGAADDEHKENTKSGDEGGAAPNLSADPRPSYSYHLKKDFNRCPYSCTAIILPKMRPYIGPIQVAGAFFHSRMGQCGSNFVTLRLLQRQPT